MLHLVIVLQWVHSGTGRKETTMQYRVTYQTDNGRETFNESETFEGTHAELSELIVDIRRNGGFNVEAAAMQDSQKAMSQFLGSKLLPRK